ncbi:MAG: DEAD/DEAH box helicase, partial [Candidatus Omnitrophota bacterium]
MFRRLIKTCLDEYLPGIVDILPYDIRQRNHLLNIASAVLNMHFPQDALRQEEAYKRIIFEECFLMQLIFGLKRYKADKITGIAHRLNEDFLKSFERGLSFKLTDSQDKVIAQIKKDMSSPKPMYRLLEGDVGSGKTVVALYGCMIAVSGAAQAVFMAPTEILAQQHYKNIKHQTSNIKYNNSPVNAALLTGSLSRQEKEKVYAGIKEGDINILVGTHALLQEGVEFKRLSLVVIDEQHKFGVYQRMNLAAKGSNLDCLIMTATPIPRTLALTIYSDLDISTINELPSGRIPVKTYLAGED